MDGQPGWFEAYDAVLVPVLGHHGLVDILVGAEACGALSALREPSNVDDLATATGLPAPRAEALVDVLVAYEVVETEGREYRLAPPWRALTEPDAVATLADTLESARIDGRLLRDAAAGTDYWTMPSEDRMVYARAVSPNPFSPALVDGFRSQLTHDPDAAALLAGGRLLELGCGVAGRVLTMLQALPAMSAVGVELSEDLAAEAVRRAEALGVADRFEVVRDDAAAFSRPETFDVAFWSQFFFPEPTRRPALATLLESLRSGGLAQAPLPGDDRAEQADPHGADARYRAAFRLILNGWDVPDRSTDELAAEFTDAGFVDVRFVGGSGSPVRLVARKP
jgi:SAM-dependent methyltransferase